MERKRGLKHPPARVTEKVRKSVKHEPSEIEKMLILLGVLWGIYEMHTFLQMFHGKSVRNRTNNHLKIRENTVQNET